MKYTINLDNENYVLSISHTDNDNIEIDLDTLELKYLHAYKLIDDTLVMDENKKQELIAEDEKIAKIIRIEELKRFLYDTDYIMARMLEEIMALSNPLTFITDILKIFVNYANKYKEQLAQRKNARDEIENLEK